VILVDARRDIGVVAQRGGAAVHRLHGADHGAQVDVARGERDRLERADIVHPQLERHVVLAALVVALVAVVMAVDQAGGEQFSAHVDRRALGRKAARPDVVNEAAVDHDIDRTLARCGIFTKQRHRSDQGLSRGHFGASYAVARRPGCCAVAGTSRARILNLTVYVGKRN
jgi:hypothetical protein